MGILNITPDSFSDGEKFFRTKDYELRTKELIQQGVDIIDVGGESTGPGSSYVNVEEEMERVKPVIDFIRDNKLTEKAVFSIDTYKSEVAEYALKNGFQMVNDVTALRGDARMAEVLLKYRPYVILMYAKDPTARTTRAEVRYEDVIAEIKSFLVSRIKLLTDVGFPKDKIIIDPGMGAFVSAIPEYSFEIINRLSELRSLGYPILVGVSRKSFLGGKTDERDPASVEYSLKVIKNGASIIRIHNVGMMRKALFAE